MADEVKAALERLRRLENNEGDPWYTETYGPRAPFDVEDDRRMVSLAFALEHPADDDEPMTPEWLDTLTVKHTIEWAWNWSGGKKVYKLVLWVTDRWRDVWLPDGATRGDVRGLLRVYGKYVRPR